MQKVESKVLCALKEEAAKEPFVQVSETGENDSASKNDPEKYSLPVQREQFVPEAHIRARSGVRVRPTGARLAVQGEGRNDTPPKLSLDPYSSTR
ncbi:hypothetical protein AVEN_95452-1 [Araneus ventricosus]|uniref:Uncharacterized protein n=1 Tax=Araneus ventricosus TaxID=182803 RepID=A0A4Y2VEW3_ARAVE|nr:hypothetical protein AVEN_95452-1 [Araneus ventricosus]